MCTTLKWNWTESVGLFVRHHFKDDQLTALRLHTPIYPYILGKLMMNARQKSTRYTNIKTKATTNKMTETMTKTNTDKLAERHYMCYIF